jgi:transposase-like protein
LLQHGIEFGGNLGSVATFEAGGDTLDGCRSSARLLVCSSGATLDFLLSATQDAEAAKRFLAKSLGRQNHPAPRVIHTDRHAAYPPAVAQLKDEGALVKNCRHRVGRYLNNVVEQDHRAIKRRMKASQHFRSFWAAWRTLAGYEASHMIRKGQAFGRSSEGGAVPLHRFLGCMFGIEV